ncbi:MAG TPA: helix-turn-helix transcriptional regulator [Bradyrhizobium sp.]|uniref:AraC family transcriptional regulator n=1 Tax=Bradyrhizobium sp. TaxID=376 RepID=UPI002BB7340C|nr:helix-turn-helix transcriptional regulator [Bradyrhizobium sp.]HLZ02458.1 helix-turn-helix transcriptional regulator [Bradyrhizobium sp.]
MRWSTVVAPPDVAPPRPITMRAQTIPPRHHFPEHAHDWHQLVYAVDGTLTVSVDRRTFVVSPDQAVWLPTGAPHSVGSLLGAEFRSLWIANEAGRSLPSSPTVLAVSPLLKALIVEAAEIDGKRLADGYPDRIAAMILDQLGRAPKLPTALPWPKDRRFLALCEALYLDPSDERNAEEWARELGMSSRTLTRRFEAELGLPLRSWKRRLRLFRAIELLGGGLSVTTTAMELGYGSASAFVFAFRSELGCSPYAYMSQRASSPSSR